MQKYRLYLKKLGGYGDKDKVRLEQRPVAAAPSPSQAPVLACPPPFPWPQVDADELQSLHERNVQQMAAQQAMQQQLSAALASYQAGGGPGLPGLFPPASAGPITGAVPALPLGAVLGTAVGHVAAPPTSAPGTLPAYTGGGAGPAGTGTGAPAATTSLGGELEGTATSARVCEDGEADTAAGGGGGGGGGTAEGIPLGEAGVVAGVPVSLPPGAAVGQPVPPPLFAPPAEGGEPGSSNGLGATWQQYAQQYAAHQRALGVGMASALAWEYPPLPGEAAAAAGSGGSGGTGGAGGAAAAGLAPSLAVPGGGSGGGGGAPACEQCVSVELQELSAPVTTRMPLHQDAEGEGEGDPHGMAALGDADASLLAAAL